MEKRRLSWLDIERAVEKLVHKLPNHYDAMLVVTRGGLVPACLLSEQMDLRNILVAAVKFYTGVGEKLDRPIFLQFPSDPFLSGKRILVVDDVWDSGNTAVAVRERVLAAGGLPDICVLHYKPKHSEYPGDGPDYYAEEMEGWIVYPWDPERDR